jgi:tetratricopeptide (TPR) repeat protein
MHSTFEIVLRTVGLLVALALVGVGFFFMLKKSDDPAKMLFKFAFTVPFVIFCIWFGGRIGLGGPFPIVFMAIVLSFMWTPHLGELIASPLTNLFDGGSERPEKKPFYSIANARRKRGLYHEAIAEVRKQLDKFPNDFEGVMLLASIQAEDMKDLPAAENVLNHFCVWPKAPHNQIAAAWTTLADWHLKIGVDVDSARASLQKILERFPGTELALKAEQRMAHLGGTEKILMAQHNRERIAVPEGVKNLGLRDSTEFLKPPEIEPGKLAAAHVKHLETHPHDSEVREKLAVIYAKDFRRLDLATMELVQLINEPRHTPKQIAGWLNLLANFQVELGADVATVRSTLQTIVDRFPDLPLAVVTQRRLERLNSEFKGKETKAAVKLGEYEQNIGLKYGGPRKQ